MSNTSVRVIVGVIMAAVVALAAVGEYFGFPAVQYLAALVSIGMIVEMIICMVRAPRDVLKKNRLAFGGFLTWLFVVCAAAIFVGADSWMMLLLLLVICSADIGAWFFGRMIGGDKMWERLSANKTWAGQIAGIACGTVAAMIYEFIAPGAFDANIIWFGVAVALLSQYGDLTASWIKRRMGLKDFGHILPGHGGILDRFDGWMYALPLVWLISLAQYGQTIIHVIVAVIAMLIVLSIVVLVHELGHFMAARWAGVKVNTFSIGFGPALLKWHDKRGTRWQIACLPLGGYVSIYGQEDMFDSKKFKALSAEKKRGHYLSVPAWKQFIIVAAGVTMNFILAWVIYSCIAMFHPKEVQLPVVGQVVQETVAFNAGVKPGDVVMKVNGQEVTNWGELVIAKDLAKSGDADVLLQRGEDSIHVKLAPAEFWGLVADGSKKEMRKLGFIDGIHAGLRETYTESKTLLVVLRDMITGERSTKDLGSFITIAEVSGQALSAGLVALLSIIALLSVNLGVINLLPLPVLDGGYLLILLIEAITRKKLQGRGMEIVIMAGWLLIFALFALTMWNDLVRVFVG